MIRYVPSSVAEKLSNALWALSRPPQVRNPEDTQYLFPWTEDLDGKKWLIVDTEYEIPVHQNADLGEIAAILNPWIQEGYLPADTNTILAQFVESKRGQKLVVYSAFPELFKNMSKTLEEMNFPNLSP